MYKTFLKRIYCQICMPVCPCGASRELRVDAHFFIHGTDFNFCGWQDLQSAMECVIRGGRMLHPSYNPHFRLRSFVFQPNTCPLHLEHPRNCEPAGHSNVLGGNQPVPAVGMARKEGGCCLKGSWWGKPKGRSLLSNSQGQLVWAA